MFENLIAETYTTREPYANDEKWYVDNRESKRLYMGVIYTPLDLCKKGWSIEEIRRDTVAVRVK